MSTDPAFTVEWTVPAEDEWGGDAPDARSRPASAERDGAATTQDRDRERLCGRDPADLPPAPVLAARVDALRADRAARERELDAVRERYETVIEARNEEIRDLRGRATGWRAVVEWVRNVL
jgi:hypothetical protein